MTTLYTVQCNVDRPDLEAEWNAWYDGPKTAHMMAKPLFLRSQRFRAHAFDVDTAYLAMWELESAQALETPEYTATWGWDRWASMITDWVRDLSVADAGERVPFAPGTDGVVHAHLAWFDSPVDPARRAELTRRGIDASAWWWGSCGGLDDSARAVALRIHTDDQQVPTQRVFEGLASKETVYRSISALAHAAPSDAVLGA